jgi:hypothetical protein
VQLLPPDVDLELPWRHEAARPVWLGVVWARLGRGDLAWAHWDRVQLPELQPWIAAERGRVVRELGLHARAEALEWPALLAATDPADQAMLRVALVADAVGAGDVARASRRLEAAKAAVDGVADGPRAARQRLRLAWVGVEVAYLRGEVPSGAGLPWWDEVLGAPAFPDDHRWGSGFHTSKGLLFAGIVHGDLRLLDAAAAVAPPVLRWAVELARADHGAPEALELARQAWAQVVPPPSVAEEVAATSVAERLGRGPGGTASSGESQPHGRGATSPLVARLTVRDASSRGDHLGGSRRPSSS